MVEKCKSLVREREEVWDHLAYCKSVGSSVLQFSRAISKLKRLEEEAKEEARADVQQRRIDRSVADILAVCYRSNQLNPCRIWEKLSEDGWHEEIAACKQMYKPELLRIKGVMMNRPLGEKGTYASSP